MGLLSLSVKIVIRFGERLCGGVANEGGDDWSGLSELVLARLESP